MRFFPAIFGNLGWQELLIILVIILVLFGPRRLPEIAEALGKSVRKFKSATRDAETELKKEVDAATKKPDDPK
jgi:sec-independent protein translocase protein TatA